MNYLKDELEKLLFQYQNEKVNKLKQILEHRVYFFREVEEIGLKTYNDLMTGESNLFISPRPDQYRTCNIQDINTLTWYKRLNYSLDEDAQKRTRTVFNHPNSELVTIFFPVKCGKCNQSELEVFTNQRFKTEQFKLKLDNLLEHFAYNMELRLPKGTYKRSAPCTKRLRPNFDSSPTPHTSPILSDSFLNEYYREQIDF